MLTYDDALNLNYYKKTTFTGWMNGMRFLIKREEPVLKEATEDTPEEKGEPIFQAGRSRGYVKQIFQLGVLRLGIAGQYHTHAGAATLAEGYQYQIGRASCRERV